MSRWLLLRPVSAKTCDLISCSESDTQGGTNTVHAILIWRKHRRRGMVQRIAGQRSSKDFARARNLRIDALVRSRKGQLAASYQSRSAGAVLPQWTLGINRPPTRSASHSGRSLDDWEIEWGGEFTTQRVTKVSAGGFPVALGCHRAIELTARELDRKKDGSLDCQ